jgi:hypothetical protein
MSPVPSEELPEHPVETVVGKVGGILLQGAVVVCLPPVVVHVGEHDLPIPLDVRAVRIPATSVKLWCLRWTAIHSRGEMLVSIHVPMRMKKVIAG